MNVFEPLLAFLKGLLPAGQLFLVAALVTTFANPPTSIPGDIWSLIQITGWVGTAVSAAAHALRFLAPDLHAFMESKRRMRRSRQEREKALSAAKALPLEGRFMLALWLKQGRADRQINKYEPGVRMLERANIIEHVQHAAGPLAFYRITPGLWDYLIRMQDSIELSQKELEELRNEHANREKHRERL